MKNLYIYKGVHIEWETEAELEARRAQIDAQDEAYLALLMDTTIPTESGETPSESVENPAESGETPTESVETPVEFVEVETLFQQSESEDDSELAVDSAEVDASSEAEVEVTLKKRRNRRNTK